MLLFSVTALPAAADSAAEIDRDVDSALQKLYRSAPAAVELSKVAKGVLVYPSVIKAGLIVGGQYGEWALRVGGKTVGYCNTVAASYGMQAGAQSFGYALFLMADEGLDFLKSSDGREVGVGPSIVVMDQGRAKSFTTTTAKDGIYAFCLFQPGKVDGRVGSARLENFQNQA